MAVSSEDNKIFHVVTSGIKIYPYDFRIYRSTDLAVYDTDALSIVTKLTEGLDYSVTNVGVVGGGNVVFVVSRTIGHKLEFIRECPYTQLNEYPEGGKFPSETVEVTEDLAVMLAQQNKELILRSIILQPGDEELRQYFPLKEARKNKIFAFDINGDVDVTTYIGENTGNWATGRLYQARDVAISVDPPTQYNLYSCQETHTSGTFAVDLAALKWKLLIPIPIIPPTAWQTGDAKLTFNPTALPDWVVADDGTIGSAASGATTRANSDTLDLYTLLWDNILDAWCHVVTGRGASAAADFAADKPMYIPSMLGRVLALQGTGGGLSPHVLGEYRGKEQHTLSIAEMASHHHDMGGNLGQSNANGADHPNFEPPNVGPQNTLNTGGDTPHNIIQPTIYTYAHIKL